MIVIDFMSVCQRIIKILCGVGEKIKHKLESFSAFIVGVGNIVVARGHSTEKLACRDDLVERLGCRGNAPEILLVGGIHRYDQIKRVEILLPDLAATMGQVETASAGVSPHARIGKLADMIVACPGRVDGPSGGIASFVNYRFHHAFGSRAATYIPEADKEDGEVGFFAERVEQRSGFRGHVAEVVVLYIGQGGGLAGVAGVGLCHAGVVFIAPVARTVVAACERGPVVATQIFGVAAFLDQVGE